MAFKTMTQYDEERFGGFFLLRNDGDYADVIFLYRNKDDVLIGDVHYIKTPDYTGYVHCTERNCPACEKGIRVQSKLFIPLYNITDGEIQFWDRSTRFENQLVQDVFSKYPNPSEFVFRIQRQGVAGDINTKYNIWAVGKNKLMDYNQILLTNNATMPDYYENICKTYSSTELHSILNSFFGGLFTEWGGNCFGLSISTVANYLGKVDLRSYFISNSGDSLNEYGFETIEYADMNTKNGEDISGNIYTVRGNNDIIH